MVIHTPLLSRDMRVRWHAETNYGHLYTFAIQRQASPMAHGDKLWSSAPFLLSRDNQVRWHAETIMVIRTLFAI